ncbi:hypothetical protein PF008_g26342 [Phytophthora fragariae]|uniref:Uncharacterized protein n=1 Tax=Phytophthora fragariae TaxID=53985 RepID=A0A6G0QHD1_9STRA|nr:hypothetical protein PF008_g26342 [Phytophthora fragariae]
MFTLFCRVFVIAAILGQRALKSLAYCVEEFIAVVVGQTGGCGRLHRHPLGGLG